MDGLYMLTLATVLVFILTTTAVYASLNNPRCRLRYRRGRRRPAQNRSTYRQHLRLTFEFKKNELDRWIAEHPCQIERSNDGQRVLWRTILALDKLLLATQDRPLPDDHELRRCLCDLYAIINYDHVPLLEDRPVRSARK